jgi:hypothetical protein
MPVEGVFSEVRGVLRFPLGLHLSYSVLR